MGDSMHDAEPMAAFFVAYLHLLGQAVEAMLWGLAGLVALVIAIWLVVAAARGGDQSC